MPTWLRHRSFVPAVCTALFAFAVTTAGAAVTPNGRLQIIHLNVGQGDGTLLISPLGECVLIDDGLYNNTAAPVAQLAALGVNHVVLHFASHYHADHIGAISQIANSGVTIDAGWDRAASYSSATYTTYVNTLGAKRHTLTKGMVFKLDSLSAHPVFIKCVDLSGAGLATSDENSKSLMLKVSYGEFDESFGGDLTGLSPYTLVESVVGPEVGPVEVYKVHHHGSAYSSSDAWLNATTPKIGVIQCGDGNTYGHPTAAALSQLHAHGVKTYWNQTGAGVAPNPLWDKVANGQIIIQATWEPGGVDTVRGPGFADTFTNSGTAVDVTPPVVSLTSPNGGESLVSDASTNVTWSATDNFGVASVDIDYSLNNGGSWTTIATGLANSGSYGWVIPGANSTQALVRVTARDAAGNLASDPSNATFTIADQTAPVVTTLTPNGGESFNAGTTQIVRWSATDNTGVDSVNVDYSLAGAAGPWSRIAHGVTNADSVAWVVPDSGSDSALVRVTAYDAALNQATDPSDNLFRIVPTFPAGVTPTVNALSFSAPLPNPSQDHVSLRFSLPDAGNARIELLDVSGRRLWSWEQAGLSAGSHSVDWDGRIASGSRAGVGLYWVRLSGAFGVRTVKLVRLN